MTFRIIHDNNSRNTNNTDNDDDDSNNSKPTPEALNGVLRQFGSGAYHCGVEVFGKEWSCPPASRYARSAAPMTASSVFRIRTFGFRPWAATPRYSLAGTSEDGTVRAKKESRRSGPGGGNTCVSDRPKSA